MTGEFTSQPDHDRTPQNAVLDATSFLFGTNAQFIEGLYAQYLADHASVDGTWRARGDATHTLGRDRQYHREEGLIAVILCADTGRGKPRRFPVVDGSTDTFCQQGLRW